MPLLRRSWDCYLDLPEIPSEISDNQKYKEACWLTTAMTTKCRRFVLLQFEDGQSDVWMMMAAGTWQLIDRD